MTLKEYESSTQNSHKVERSVLQPSFPLFIITNTLYKN